MTSRRASTTEPHSSTDPAATLSARAIVESLRAGEPTSAEMFEAFWHLDSLPVEEVRDALASWVGPLPDVDRLDPATRLAIGLPLRALRLRTVAVDRDADILDLGPIAEEQLRLAGKSWDGADLAAEDRLDGELDGSFAGTLERRVLADAETTPETPLFDVLLFGGDSGVVFTAGTTDVVALIAYRLVEMRDRRSRVAIQEALDAPAPVTTVRMAPVVGAARPDFVVEEKSVAAPEAVVEPARPEIVDAPEPASPPERATAKKAASKAATSGAKKTAARKVASSKVAKKLAVSASKKTAASKKRAAKKSPAKKTSASSPKKGVKAPARKTAAKKTPKKTATRAGSRAPSKTKKSVASKQVKRATVSRTKPASKTSKKKK